MDMDPTTRCEAQKIEGVLTDLVRDLELLSLLPDEFTLWLRDDITATVEKSALLTPTTIGGEEKGPRPETAGGGGVGVEGEEGAAVSSPAYPGESETRQRLIRACGFVRAAAHYGDPADVVGNEAIVQVSEFNELERELLEGATTVGHVDAEDIEFHHLSLRALLDTLREGGYLGQVEALLERFYPAAPRRRRRRHTGNNNNNNGNGNDGGGGGNANYDANKTSLSGAASAGQTSLLPPASLTATTTATATATAVTSDHRPYSEEGDEDDDEDDDDDNDESDTSERSEAGLSLREDRATMGGHKKRYNRHAAVMGGVVSAPVDHVRHVLRVLAWLMTLRNSFTVNEDIHRYKVLHEAVNKEQSATADVQALNREYEEAKEARRREVAALDAEVAALEQELAEVERSAEDELAGFHAANAEAQAAQRSAYAAALEQHRQEAQQLHERLDKTQGQHAESINQLRSQLAKKEAAVSGAIAEYDTQMSTMRGTVDKLQHDAELNTEQVVALEEQLQRLMKEQSEYELEQRVAERRQEHLNAIAQRQEQHVRVLQAYYRAFLARLETERAMERAAKKGKKRSKRTKAADKRRSTNK